MKLTNFFLFTVVVLFSFIPTSRGAAEGGREVVESIIENAKKISPPFARSSAARQIEAMVDFDALTRSALGKYAKQVSDSQLGEIRDLLRRVIGLTVYPDAPKFFTDVKIQFTNHDSSDEEVHLSSVVTKKDRRSTVEYWLKPTTSGYRVVDLSVEGERWVPNVRDQFEEVIQKNGVSGLISRLKKRVNQLQLERKSQA